MKSTRSMLFVARAFTDRAHASIIFPAAKLVHPLLSMEIPVAPEAATLDPVAGRREKPRSGSRHEDRSFVPSNPIQPSSPPFTPCVSAARRVERCSTSSFRPLPHRYDYEVGTDRPRVGMPRRVAPVPRTRLVLDSASIERKFIRDPILT